MKTTAFVIADWFIAHNEAFMKYNSGDEISNLKIQKLLYYAQGCALASLGEALFDDDIVAWKHGPVVESIYQKYYEYGRKGISNIPQYPILEAKIENLLINTYNTFAKYSAWELANLTYMEDPWKLTPINETISLHLIENYFSIHYRDVNKDSRMMENIQFLREIENYEENWDGEDASSFDSKFIREIIDLISTMKLQPDIGPTGRGSIDFEYGSRKSGNKYLCLGIYEKDRAVHVYWKNIKGGSGHETIGMEDVNGRIQQF
ncbi:MAG: DUF4065 domain-containing protein [Clostridia bacterium]|nr:DUF4065 domain-containing protein [Clostridia bacterium]